MCYTGKNEIAQETREQSRVSFYMARQIASWFSFLLPPGFFPNRRPFESASRHMTHIGANVPRLAKRSPKPFGLVRFQTVPAIFYMRGGDVALTEKQRRFAAEYIVDLNATQAAIRAGYSEKTAAEQACRLLINVKVQEEIKKAMDDRSARTEITQDMVLRELAAIGFSKATDYVRIQDGIVLIQDTNDLADAQKSAIASIENGKYGVKIRLHDKIRALERLGDHLGMFTGKEAEQNDIDDDGLLAALGSNAKAVFSDGDDSDMLPKEKEE